ncbi:DUF4249 domain-containing protein [Hymenobacter lapidiphilus]|uniref:DUF4249 domain-containing protein n=1 Tax=Hymenobacter sp. CCM 8763 TaxID=2303334 RepID=UPI000E34DF22|nr:DUF4249 domain-containing protein [Hymenobacter sp. CCM 8763]RFP66005.1 DUF4249 domain-containing protein [Hymenobacter sp. CCM 8763]
MDKLRLLLGVSLGLGLAGCETVVDVDTPPHTPRMALSYTLSNTPPEPPTTTNNRSFFEQRKLYVSSSQGVLETKELTGRGDATVQLFDESGQLVEQFRSKAQPGYYSGGSRPDSIYGDYAPTRGFAGVPGRRYTLRASAPGVEAVEASLRLPAVPTIESVGYVARPRDPNSGGPYGYVDYGGRLTVAVADNPATTDYYLAYARVLDKQGNYWGGVSRDYSAPGADGPDINLSRFQLSQPDSFYSQYPYSDATSSGPLLSFGTDVRLYFQGGYGSGGSIPEPGYLEVIVSSITPDTYQFFQSVLRFYNTDGNPFAEPAPLHSNLRGGYGLFGGATDAVYRIKLF